MSRIRAVVGLIVGAALIASSGAHMVLGWAKIHAQLEAANAGRDLERGVGLVWHFSGLAMLVFGIIVILAFADLLRGRPVSLLPALIIGLAYLLIGLWAFSLSHNPFFLIFIIPGLALTLVSIPWKTT